MKTKEQIQKEINDLQEKMNKIDKADKIILVSNSDSVIAKQCKQFVASLIKEINDGEYHQDNDWRYYAFEAICEAVHPNFFKWFNKKV